MNLITYISALAIFCLALASNTTTSIHFYSDNTGCANHWFGCSDLPVGYCCASSSPYCRWVQCVDCHARNVTTYQLTTHTNGNCSGNPSFSCTATTIDSCCKVNNPAGSASDVCSVMVVPGASDELKRDIHQCLGAREPNVFGFTHENGTMREFHMDHVLYQSALVLAEKQDFDGLVARLG